MDGSIGANVGVRLVIVSFVVSMNNGRLSANLWLICTEAAVQRLRRGNERSLTLSCLWNGKRWEGQGLESKACIGERLNLTTSTIQSVLKSEIVSVMKITIAF